MCPLRDFLEKKEKVYGSVLNEKILDNRRIRNIKNLKWKNFFYMLVAFELFSQRFLRPGSFTTV